MASESESERRETSADIADEIRRAVESMGAGLPYTVSAGTMRRVADRIEAAAKRQEKTYLDQIRDAMNMWGHEKHIAEHAQKPTVGNAAAMREALVAVKKSIDGIGESSLDCDPTILMAALTQVCARLSSRIERALSAPARNCDKFADAESARQAWLDDVDNWDEFGSPKLELHEWLFAPAAERKGDCDGR